MYASPINLIKQGNTHPNQRNINYDRPSDCQERRVQLRCGAPGAAVRAARPGQEPAVQRAQPGGVGAAVPAQQAPHLPHPGRAAGRAVLAARLPEGGGAGAAVPLRRLEEQAHHGPGGGGAAAAPAT
jgi:hypothetical protein